MDTKGNQVVSYPNKTINKNLRKSCLNNHVGNDIVKISYSIHVAIKITFHL